MTAVSEQLDFDSVTARRGEADEKRAVCALIAADPRNQASVDAVTEAVSFVAWRDETVDLNRVRPLLPPWVAPHVIGATISGLVAKKVLRRIDWTENKDRKGRNSGKPLAVYEFNGVVR